MPVEKAANWRVSYYWSKSSGLRLGTCDFGGERVIHSASVPFVYVNYWGNTSGPFTDRLQSKSSTVEVREIMRGFDLKVVYDLYGEDYQYEHVWRFHDDGQFGSTILIHGPGEEIYGRHTYHIPFRFDIDMSGASHDSFQKAGASGWEDVSTEGSFRPVAPPAFDWRVIDKKSGHAARVRARASDAAELWALAYKEAESWGSWGSAGAGVPGSPDSVPAIYDNGQSLQDTNVVLWYIAHIPAIDRVTACGPWFALEGLPGTEPPPQDDAGPHGHGDDGHGDHGGGHGGGH
jgi:hypothetical protein